MIRMLAAIGFATVLCACSQTPAKIADLSPERLAAIDDTALCDAVNSSTRSASGGWGEAADDPLRQHRHLVPATRP